MKRWTACGSLCRLIPPFRWCVIALALTLACFIGMSAFFLLSVNINRSAWVEVSHGWIVVIHWDTSGPTTMTSKHGTGMTGSMTWKRPLVSLTSLDHVGLRLHPQDPGFSSPSMVRIGVPLLVPLGACCAAYFVSRWASRRTRLPGHCSACGYLLAGLPCDTPCPECGHSRGNSRESK